MINQMQTIIDLKCHHSQDCLKPKPYCIEVEEAQMNINGHNVIGKKCKSWRFCTDRHAQDTNAQTHRKHHRNAGMLEWAWIENNMMQRGECIATKANEFNSLMHFMHYALINLNVAIATKTIFLLSSHLNAPFRFEFKGELKKKYVCVLLVHGCNVKAVHRYILNG